MHKYPYVAIVNWQITVMLLLSTAIAEKNKSSPVPGCFYDVRKRRFELPRPVKGATTSK